MLYIATGTSTTGMMTWALRVDPNTGASSVVVTFSIQNTNVCDLAFDARDSLCVPRVGFNQIIHRVDPVTAIVTTFSPQQPDFGYLGMDVVRNVTGCPSDTKRTTWGRVKGRYH